MNPLRLLAVALLTMASAHSQHITAFTGTWKLDVARSRFVPGPPFRDFILTFTPDGTRHILLTTADGHQLKIDLPWSGGQEVTPLGMDTARTVSTTRGRVFNDTWRQNGKIIETVQGEVSADSQTLRITVKGPLTPSGRFHNRLLFHRQSPPKETTMPTSDHLQPVAPALDYYEREKLFGDLWKRPGLSARDRSLVTVAALIARNQTAAMARYFELALDNGVKPAELSEVITHLAFYSGWGNATAAVAVARDIFAVRGVTPADLPTALGDRLPIDEASENLRATRVQQDYGQVAPGVVEYTTHILFRDLWLRPALAPRDRSLVTVSALVAAGQSAQVAYHLNRAMDNGLTQSQAAEALTHLAFYAGWPNVFSAMPVAKSVFESRPR